MRLAVAFIISLAATWMASGSAEGQDAPVFTKNTRFRIPYRYDAAEMQKLGAKEIRLFVSYDSGTRWQFVNTVAPETGKFEFEAPGDGEYWFAVRTVDYQNRLHPDGEVVEPGLKVTVDSSAPTLELQLSQPEPGKVQLHWNASDANIDLETLKLESVEPGSTEWQQVRIVPQGSGQTSWSVPEGGFVQVRGTVKDRASNTASAQSQAHISPRISRTPRSQPDFSQPVASTPSTPTLSMGAPSTVPRGQFIADHHDRRPAIVRERYDVQPQPQSEGPSRIVNTPKFQIGYQVDDVGPSGLSSVEFYISEDDGAKWWGYGSDPDGRSPFEVSVPRDGRYGFTLRARSGAGLANDPPQPGEKPAIVVVVDQTPPVAQLLGAHQGQGAELNKILIQWKASDQHLAKDPIALAYATDLSGPWKPISGWQPNSGSFAWTVDATMPPRLYIRLTARDSAGNETRVESSQPVIVDLSRPTARIVDIEAIPGVQY